MFDQYLLSTPRINQGLNSGTVFQQSHHHCSVFDSFSSDVDTSPWVSKSSHECLPKSLFFWLNNETKLVVSKFFSFHLWEGNFPFWLHTIVPTATFQPPLIEQKSLEHDHIISFGLKPFILHPPQKINRTNPLFPIFFSFFYPSPQKTNPFLLATNQPPTTHALSTNATARWKPPKPSSGAEGLFERLLATGTTWEVTELWWASMGSEARSGAAAPRNQPTKTRQKWGKHNGCRVFFRWKNRGILGNGWKLGGCDFFCWWKLMVDDGWCFVFDFER